MPHKDGNMGIKPSIGTFCVLALGLRIGGVIFAHQQNGQFANVISNFGQLAMYPKVSKG